METYELALSIILVSVGIGMVASAVMTDETGNNHGEVHEHALFHVVINGSEMDFSDRMYQLNAEDVHLENNKSDIVHKHEAGVTWGRFLETINTTYWRSNATGNLCFSTYGYDRCGDGQVYLNGEEVDGLDDEVIHQGDHLLVILDTANSTAVMEEYMLQQLPRDYKPEATRGRRV